MRDKTRLCKLTRPDLTTYMGFKWEVGVWRETSGAGDLCGPGWLHCYEHPLLAVLHNPIHANYDPAILWLCEAGGKLKRDGQLKCGVTRLRLMEEIPIPAITTYHRIRYAIYASGCHRKGPIQKWANGWLNGTDRTKESAWAAAEAEAAAEAAAELALARAAQLAARAAQIAAKRDPTLDLTKLAVRATKDEK